MLATAVLTVALACGALSLVVVSPDTVVLSNEYVTATFDRNQPQITTLAGTLAGGASLLARAPNVLAGQGQADPLKLHRAGFVLESVTAGRVSASTDSLQVTVALVANTTSSSIVRLSGITDRSVSPCVDETWTLSLAEDSRWLSVDIQGQTTCAGVAVLHTAYLNTPSIYALYDNRGVVQMMSNPDKFFPVSGEPLSRVYSLGGNASLEIFRDNAGSNDTLLLTNGPFFQTALQEAVGASSLPGKNEDWSIYKNNSDPWMGHENTRNGVLSSYTSKWRLAPVDGDFPVGTPVTRALAGNLPESQLRAFLTGIYASPVGCLESFNKDLPGQIAPSIHHPESAYKGLYNFFDPDNFISTSAMLYSGDPFLANEVRKILERTGSFALDNGQLPHHLIGTKPTYVALSGATQTGPQIFWTLSVLQYARATSNFAWLEAQMPLVRRVVGFLFSFYDPSVALLNAPGPLYIDVFIRNQYASDSNAGFVLVLREFAEAEGLFGNSTGYSYLNHVADLVSASMNRYLYNTVDHYITQLDTDLNTTRDFIDYDANLLAVALGIASVSDGTAANVLARVDRGNCTHAGRATYVSERFYGPKDCYNGNIGDSNTAMGRIAYFDAHARRMVGDKDTFDRLILDPLINDVLTYTWLHERYLCDGSQAHSEAYFEYPSVTAMMMRELRFGINIGLRTLTIRPWLASPHFSYAINNLQVDFSRDTVSFSVSNGNHARTVAIHSLVPSAMYTVSLSGHANPQCSSTKPLDVSSDPDGVLSFELVDLACAVRVHRTS